IDELRSFHLQFPIDGVSPASIKGSFYEMRGCYRHEASDILSARNTPIHAVSDGTIAKLFLSKAGGNTIYEYDPANKYVYYYAHLERYADNIHDGDKIS